MKKHKRYHNQIKDDKQKEYDEMESSQADMTDFRRPPYAVKRMIQAQAEQIRENPAAKRLTEKGVLLMQGDCLELLKDIPDGSVDMVLADLPYGTTQNEWDCIIPLSALWAEYKRVIRTGGAVVLFAQTPFDKVLGASNIEWLRYEFCWNKTRATGHLNANKRPLKAHENILVFFQTFSDTYDTTDYFSGLKDYMISEYETSPVKV